MNDKKWEQLLETTLYRRNCPPTMIVTHHHMGFLTEEEQSQWRSHLQTCQHCLTDLAELKQFMAIVEADLAPSFDMDEAPALSWVNAAGCRWTHLKERGNLLIELLNEIVTPKPVVPIAVRGQYDNQDNTVLRRITLTYEETGVADIEAIVRQDLDKADICTITVQVRTLDCWPDYAGISVQVNSDTWSENSISDAEGFVVFRSIPINFIDNFSIQIKTI